MDMFSDAFMDDIFFMLFCIFYNQHIVSKTREK